MFDTDLCPYEMFAGRLTSGAVKLPVDPSYQRKLAKLCLTPAKHNALWRAYLAENLMSEALDLHLPVFESREASFGDTASWFAARDHGHGAWVQTTYPLFTNILRRPAFGPRFAKKTERYSRTWERPSFRAAAAPFWVFTFEHDDDAVDALQMQLDWIWQKDKAGQTQLDKIDASLRARFKDYRGYCVVWSGGKSLHIHLVFDTGHLSRSVIKHLAARAGNSPEAKLRDHWQGQDANPGSLWAYYGEQWFALRDLIHNASAISVPFDQQMAVLSQKRRMPWGLRQVSAGNAFGCVQGESIVQIVVAEKLLKRSPKGSTTYFNSAAAANQVAPRAGADSVRALQGTYWIDDTELLARLTLYLKRCWGAEYPKPAYLADHNGRVRLHFFNNADDKTPSSFVREDYNQILYCGAGAPADDMYARLPGGLNLGDLVDVLVKEEDLQYENSVARKPQPSKLRMGKLDRFLFEREAMGGRTAGVRKGLRHALAAATRYHPRSLVVSTPGAGKSTTLLDQALDYRAEDWLEGFFSGQGLAKPANGFTIFACQSYEQAEEQFQRYIAPTADGRVRPAVLLKSFDRHYSEYCDDAKIPAKERITYAKALAAGYPNMLLAVTALQPQIYQAVTARKNDAWLTSDQGQQIHGFERNGSVVVFTSHRLGQTFNVLSESRAWLHPDYRPGLPRDAWTDLAKAFQAYLLIHDEVSLDDLFHIATEEDLHHAVCFERRLEQVRGKNWRDVPDAEKFDIFSRDATDAQTELGFSRIKELVEIGFETADRETVDFDHMPFGVNNSSEALYAKMDGSVYYVRPKTWFLDLRSRVVITTTEAHIAAVVPSLQEGGVRVFRTSRMDSPQCFPVEHIPLKLDWRARKADVQELASDLVYGQAAESDTVISDMVNAPFAITHDAARGRNDLADQSTAIVLTFLGAEQYGALNVLSQRFVSTIDGETEFSFVQLFYRDRVTQAAGRNRGLRSRGTATSTQLVMSPKLYETLGGPTFFGTGLFPTYLSTMPQHGSSPSSQANLEGTV